MEVWLKNLYRAFLEDPSVTFEGPTIFESHLFSDNFWCRRSPEVMSHSLEHLISLETIIDPRPEHLIGKNEAAVTKLLRMHKIGYAVFVGYHARPETSRKTGINFMVRNGIVVDAW